MTNAIEVNEVTRTFSNSRALDAVSFSVPEGAICGLLGRNGAGKTTLMSLIAGQDRPTSGAIRVNGANPFENAEVLSQISYIRDNQRYPESYQLHHVLRIAPTFAPRWNSELAEELVDGFRIPQKIDVRKLSRGQLSAIAATISLASRSPVTLLDEPYLGLDVSARRFFYEMLIREVAEVPRTILFSTHLIEEAEHLFDRIVLIERGRIVLDGEADEARATAYLASGVGDGISAFLSGRDVLSRQRVGSMQSAVLRGELNDELREDAAHNHVQLSPATLQDLAIAYGTPTPGTEDTAEPKPARQRNVRKGASS